MDLGTRAGLSPLKAALQAYSLRHRVVSSNIANAETPGYRPLEADFEARMQRVMQDDTRVSLQKSDPKHLSGRSAPDSLTPVEPTPQVNQTEVDLEKEIVSMVKNQLSYRLAVRLLDMKYRQLHTAITGGQR